MGEELISLQKNYDGYSEDLSAKNRSQCDGIGDCGQSFFNILKRKVANVPAIDYRQNSVGSADRSVIFERKGMVFQFYHASWYPLPFNVDEMKKHADGFIGYQNFEQILSTFKFVSPISHCADSDDGKNIYIQGNAMTTSNGTTLHVTSDSCATHIDNASPSEPQYVEGLASCFGEDCYISEGYCSEYQGSPIDAKDFIHCPKGCNDGVCR